MKRPTPSKSGTAGGPSPTTTAATGGTPTPTTATIVAGGGPTTPPPTGSGGGTGGVPPGGGAPPAGGGTSGTPPRGGGSSGMKIMNVNFFDLRDREVRARARLKDEWQVLENRRVKVGSLGEADQRELSRLSGLIALANGTASKDPQFIDPLFATARSLLGKNSFGLTPIDVEHDGRTDRGNAVLKFPAMASAAEDERDREVARVGLALGLLQVWNVRPPRLLAKANPGAEPDETDPNYGPFGEALVRAMARASANLPLAVRVLKTLTEAVNVRGDSRVAEISTVDYAKTFEKLLDKKVHYQDPSIKLKIEDSFDRVQDIGNEPPLHEFVIDLPDLEAATDIEIIPDHCRCMGSFIFASAFEELKAFQVVDKLIEMSQRGDIPLVRGQAGTQLYNYWREAPNRMSEVERQNFYAMTLGLPTGQPGVAVNTEFQDLWLRFVSSVSTLVRESRVESLLRSNLPMAVNQQQVKKAARDLAHNMSSRGYGMSFYAAADLNKQIKEIIELLSYKELQRVFGATSPYDVIEQVAHTELGGARNSSKYRMLATSGAIITNWLADNADRMRDATAQMIDLTEVSNPPGRASGQTAVSNPTDYDLVNACEMWLADSAMGDDRVRDLSEPRESPQSTSRPIQIPSIARDLLEGAGLGLGMGMPPPRSNGHGYTNGHPGYGTY